MEYDVKKALKDAKEFVKNKDYNSALDTCKGVLKHEKNNYLSWVLSAVSFQELGQREKALTAFVKATELQPDQLTAWQGLAAFLEQERNQLVVTTDGGQQSHELSQKLCDVYKKLECFLKSDPVKHINILKKQCELYKSLGQLENSADRAILLLNKGDKEITKSVAKILSPVLSLLDHPTLQILGSSLDELFYPEGEKLDKFFIEQKLLVALQLKQYLKAVTVASEILISNPKHVPSLEVIAHAFVEEKEIDVSLDRVGQIIDALLSENPKSEYGLLAKARWLLLNGKPLEAKQLLEFMNTKDATRKSRILCEAYQELHQWTKVENICRDGLESTVPIESDQRFWKLMLIKSLMETGGVERLKEASMILDNIRDEAKTFIMFRLLETTYLLRSNQLEKCKHNLDVLEEEQPIGNMDKVLLIKAEYFEKTGRDVDAVQLLDLVCESYPQNVEVLLKVAKMLWHSSSNRGKSVAIMLNVIKLNRDIAEPYLLVGTFYGEQQHNTSSLQRAVRCLEKAFQLDPYDIRTCEKLLELYRLLDDISSAVKLLEVVVRCNVKNRRWAWLQKGLLHLKMFQKQKHVPEKEKEAGLAITSLQNAMAIDSNDSSGWEALGEAYIARGSYTAALKAFQRASELNPLSTYSSYQIASIKQIMGENAEAVIAFEALLKQTPDYVPALKGLAETVLNQAIDYLTDGFTGRTVDCCTKAFDLLVRASRLNSHLACVWALLGQVCLLLRNIPKSDFTLLNVPPVLHSDKDLPITKILVMEMGPKFFLSALRLLPDSGALWHNLALSYQACWKLDQTAAYKSSALAAIKKAITLEPKDSSHWDLLGLVATEPAIRQHAFIRALELSPNAPRTAATWTHLGALYMENGDLHLAHECFKQSQNIDPFHVAAWIGQGNIAEQLSPAEAMDLFRHTATIGSGSPGQCEGSPSYAQWVINTLADPLAKQTAHYRYSIVQMHAVPVAIDSLVKYVALYPDDSCALNLLGLLYERQGLFRKAEEAFLNGIEHLTLDDSTISRSRMDKMKANLARLYTYLDRCDEATELYGTLQESELSSACGIALAHFKANRHAESYVTYEAALHWLASDDEKRSHLLVAMAMAAFRRDFPDAEAANLLLYESSQLQPPSVYGLLALGALGLLTEDDTLTTAAFQELLPYQTEPRYVADISRLSSYQQSLLGNELQGQREIARNIHMLPNVPELWTLLASFKASVAVQASHSRPSDGVQVARWAEIAFGARCQSDSAADHVFQTIDMSQVISLISLGYLLAGEDTTSLTTAQKAVHCNPHSAASWSVLLAAALPFWSGTGTVNDRIQRLGWLKKLIEHLRRKCDVTVYSRLTPWLGHYERRLVSLLSQS